MVCGRPAGVCALYRLHLVTVAVELPTFALPGWRGRDRNQARSADKGPLHFEAILGVLCLLGVHCPLDMRARAGRPCWRYGHRCYHTDSRVLLHRRSKEGEV